MNSDVRRVLVTGGAGFVGSHLVDRLVGLGHSVTVLDNLSSGRRENVHPSAQLIEGDVRDNALITDITDRIDLCYHLAAIASVNQCNASWVDSHSINQSAFVGLLERSAKRKTGVFPIIYASSAAVYGDTEHFPVKEEAPLHPISVYGADKAACEHHAHAAGRNGKVPTFGLRPFNIYGPRQHASSPYSGVITIFADRLKKGQNLQIYGDGNQTRDFIYVSDIVDYFIAAIEHAAEDAPVCNAATGHETSILAVARHLAKTLGVEARFSFSPGRDGDIFRSVANTSRAQKLLGVEAKIDIESGLTSMLKA